MTKYSWIFAAALALLPMKKNSAQDLEEARRQFQREKEIAQCIRSRLVYGYPGVVGKDIQGVEVTVDKFSISFDMYLLRNSQIDRYSGGTIFRSNRKNLLLWPLSNYAPIIIDAVHDCDPQKDSHHTNRSRISGSAPSQPRAAYGSLRPN